MTSVEQRLGQWRSPLETYKRRENVCIGYSTDYEPDTQTRIVRVYAVQNQRTDAFLGELRMKRAEWRVFFEHVYERWEDLNPPIEMEDPE